MPFVYALFLAVALVGIECLIGGTRLLYSIPFYGLLSFGGVLALTSMRRVTVRPSLPCLLSTLLLVGYIAGRAVFSPWPFLSIDDLFLLLGCLLVYLFVCFYVTDSRSPLLVIGAFLLLALADVLVGLIQFSQGKQFMLFGLIRGADGRRASGTLISANHLAGYLEVVGIMAVSLFCWARFKSTVRLLVGYSALCCYVGIALCGSRGGYISTVVSLVTFGMCSAVASRRVGRSRVSIVTVVAIAGSVALVTAAISLMSNSNYLRSRLDRVANDEARLLLGQAALDQFRIRPILGTGAGTHLYYGRLFRREHVQQDPVHAHNDYLELLAEYGLIGLAVVGIFCTAHLRSGLQSAKWLALQRLRVSHEGRSTAFALQAGAISGVVAYLAHSVVDFNMHIPGNAMVLAFLFGLLAMPDPETNDTHPRFFEPWFRCALPVLSLAFLGWGVVQTVRYQRAGRSLAGAGAWTPAMILPRLPGAYWSEQTRVALRNGDFVSALGLAQKALSFDPKNPTLHFYEGEANRGLAVRVVKHPVLAKPYLTKAVAAYQCGLQFFPEDEHLLVRLAQSLDGLNRFEEAETVFQKAFAVDPKLGIIHAYYGAHLRKLGRLEEAAEHYKQANRVSSFDVSKVGLSELGNP